MKARWAVVMIVGAWMVWPVQAMGAGYAQNVQGASAAGVSGAMVARPNTAEAGYYNPAGWVLQGSGGVSLSGAASVPWVDVEVEATEESGRAALDGRVQGQGFGFVRRGDVAVGLYGGQSYGGGLKWPEDWEGRYEVGAMEVSAWEVAPSVAYRPIDRVALGVGPRIVRGAMSQANRVAASQDGQEYLWEMEASAVGVGMQAGAWAAVSDSLALGASWRSAIDLEMEASTQALSLEDGEPWDLEAMTTTVLPQRWSLGLAYRMAPMGILSLDLEYRRWGAYDRVEVGFDDSAAEPVVEERDWEGTLAMRAGVEARGLADGLIIRSGLAIEPSPAPEREARTAQPDGDRTVVSLGGGFEITSEWRIDGAYQFIILDQNASQGDGFEGIYDGQIHAFAMGLSGRF